MWPNQPLRSRSFCDEDVELNVELAKKARIPVKPFKLFGLASFNEFSLRGINDF